MFAMIEQHDQCAASKQERQLTTKARDAARDALAAEVMKAGGALRVDATLEPGDAVYVPAGYWHCGGDNAEQEHSILLSVALSLPEAARGDGAVAWREAARTSRETFLHVRRAAPHPPGRPLF